MTTIDTKRLKVALEAWSKYGAYLIGVTGISKDFPGVDFQSAYVYFPTNGAWSTTALRQAWSRGQN
jgi:hypothetical protein